MRATFVLPIQSGTEKLTKTWVQNWALGKCKTIIRILSRVPGDKRFPKKIHSALKINHSLQNREKQFTVNESWHIETNEII